LGTIADVVSLTGENRILVKEGMARFLPMYEGKLATRKGGCGTYHMENDYRSNPNYKWTREAIRIMNEH